MSTIKPSENDFTASQLPNWEIDKNIEYHQKLSQVELIEMLKVANIKNLELEIEIDKLRHIQQTSEKSQIEFSNLFDFAPNGYFILDSKGDILNVNIEGSKQLGIDKKQLIGNPLSIFINSKQQQDEFYLHRKRLIEKNTLQRCDVELKRKDGSVFSARMECSMIRDDTGNFKHFNCLLFDISDKIEQSKKMEIALGKEKELNELKSRFISMASHEFRTPLASILSSIYLLEKYNELEAGEKRLNHINKIKNSVQGLNEILIDFLSLSQIEKGMIKNNPETFNLLRFIEDVIEETKTSAPNHSFEFIHKGEKQDVFLDKKLLKICVTNLLGNAIKYSPLSKTIKIKAESKSEENNFCISIRDEGIGIPENDKPHIFQQFFRAKNADTFQGTGLGLNIIKKLITMMDGEISFTSQINKGSVFYLKFWDC